MLCAAFAAAFVPAPARAIDDFAHPVEPTAVYDPASVLKIGTYAGRHFDLRAAFSNDTAVQTDETPESRDEIRRLGYRYSHAVDDAVRDRISATLGDGDPAKIEALRSRINNDAILEEAVGAVRVFGMHETDLADVTTALVIESYDASHAVSLTARQGIGLSRTMRRAMLASPVLPTLDDAAKQTAITEMIYQVLLFESDASTFGYGRDDANLTRLRAAVVTAMAQLGLSLAQMRPTDDGVELVPKAR